MRLGTGKTVVRPSAAGRDPYHQILVDQLGAILWEADPERRRFVSVRGPVEELLGLPRDAWLEPGFWEAHLHPEDRERAIRVGRQHASIGTATVRERNSADDRLEYRMVGAEGRVAWVEDLVLVEPGDPSRRTAARLRGVLIDAHERKATEQALRTAEDRIRLHFEHNPAAIFEWQLTDGRFLLRNCNAAALRFTHGRAIGLLGHDARALYPDRPDIVNDLWTSLRTREPITREMDYEMRITREKKHLIVRYVFVPEDQVLIHVEDVTQRQEIRQQADLLRSQLAHAARVGTIGELAAGLAHEINQPLAAIANFAEASLNTLARGPGGAGELKENLERILAQAERSSEIVRWLRRFVKTRESRRDLFSLNDAVREVLHVMEYELRRRAIALELDLAQELPAVAADGIEIQQVLVNLIRNACESMDVGEKLDGPIRIATFQTPWAVRFEISDCGHGPRTQELEKLFEPFFTTKSGGLGLGLSLCQSILRAHRGEIGAMVNEEGGMTFYFELPKDEAAPAWDKKSM